MKLRLQGIILTLVILLIANRGWAQISTSEKPRTLSFDHGWQFIKENPSGAENASFDDSHWRTLNLPHDWSIEDLPGQNGDSISGPFSKASIGKMGTGFTV